MLIQKLVSSLAQFFAAPGGHQRNQFEQKAVNDGIAEAVIVTQFVDYFLSLLAGAGLLDSADWNALKQKHGQLSGDQWNQMLDLFMREMTTSPGSLRVAELRAERDALSAGVAVTDDLTAKAGRGRELMQSIPPGPDRGAAIQMLDAGLHAQRAGRARALRRIGEIDAEIASLEAE